MTAPLNNVSIIIVTYQGDGLTKNCLDSLAATCGAMPQVVVVDNSPSEATTRFAVNPGVSCRRLEQQSTRQRAISKSVLAQFQILNSSIV